MNVYFSGTDMDELHDNAPQYDMYLSVIVNNKNQVCTKIAVSGKAKEVSTINTVHGVSENVEEKDILILINGKNSLSENSYTLKTEGELEISVGVGKNTALNGESLLSRCVPTEKKERYAEILEESKKTSQSNWGNTNYNYNYNRKNNSEKDTKCSNCRGTGYSKGKTCRDCYGTGKSFAEKNSVKAIPPQTYEISGIAINNFLDALVRKISYEDIHEMLKDNYKDVEKGDSKTFSGMIDYVLIDDNLVYLIFDHFCGPEESSLAFFDAEILYNTIEEWFFAGIEAEVPKVVEMFLGKLKKRLVEVIDEDF